MGVIPRPALWWWWLRSHTSRAFRVRAPGFIFYWAGFERGRCRDDMKMRDYATGCLMGGFAFSSGS